MSYNTFEIISSFYLSFQSEIGKSNAELHNSNRLEVSKKRVVNDTPKDNRMSAKLRPLVAPLKELAKPNSSDLENEANRSNKSVNSETAKESTLHSTQKVPASEAGNPGKLSQISSEMHETLMRKKLLERMQLNSKKSINVSSSAGNISMDIDATGSENAKAQDVLCPHDLLGKCTDSNCPMKHVSHFTSSAPTPPQVSIQEHNQETDVMNSTAIVKKGIEELMDDKSFGLDQTTESNLETLPPEEEGTKLQTPVENVDESSSSDSDASSSDSEDDSSSSDSDSESDSSDDEENDESGKSPKQPMESSNISPELPNSEQKDDPSVETSEIVGTLKSCDLSDKVEGDSNSTADHVVVRVYGSSQSDVEGTALKEKKTVIHVDVNSSNSSAEITANLSQPTLSKPCTLETNDVIPCETICEEERPTGLTLSSSTSQEVALSNKLNPSVLDGNDLAHEVASNILLDSETSHTSCSSMLKDDFGNVGLSSIESKPTTPVESSSSIKLMSPSLMENSVSSCHSDTIDSSMVSVTSCVPQTSNHIDSSSDEISKPLFETAETKISKFMKYPLHGEVTSPLNKTPERPNIDDNLIGSETKNSVVICSFGENES